MLSQDHDDVIKGWLPESANIVSDQFSVLLIIQLQNSWVVDSH